MGNVKIRYYVTRQHDGRPKWGYWAPCLKRRSKKSGRIEPTLMAQLGFELVDCGEDGPRAWAIAQSWNQKWDEALLAHRDGRTVTGTEGPVYPRCSLGEGFAKFKATAEWQRRKPRTREDWERGWKYIAPYFGDVDPRTVAFEDLDLWYSGSADGEIKGLLQTASVREAHRAVKIWRALWNVLLTFNNPEGDRYVTGDDPSLGIRRETPKPRSAVWREGEVVRLVKGAWRMGFHGLAVALAVAWDTMLSPIDVVKLTGGQRLKDGKKGPFQFIERTKTGVAVIGSIGKRTERLLQAYLAERGVELHPDAPLFYTRGSKTGAGGRRAVAYRRPTLGIDFAIVRDVIFPGDTRQIIDFRRSGAVEAEAGDVSRKALAGKMGNTIDTNQKLADTYLPQSGPQTAVLVQMADAARVVGRGRLRKGGEDQ